MVKPITAIRRLVQVAREAIVYAEGCHHPFEHDYVYQERHCAQCRKIKAWKKVLKDFEKFGSKLVEEL